MEKADGVPIDNYCEFEWNIAFDELTSAKMIPVMFEPECTNPSKWPRGMVKATLGRKLGFDLSEEGGRYEFEFQGLVKEIETISGEHHPAAPSNPHPKLPGRQPQRYLVWVSLWRGLA
jgi:hypothetical protein